MEVQPVVMNSRIRVIWRFLRWNEKCLHYDWRSTDSTSPWQKINLGLEKYSRPHTKRQPRILRKWYDIGPTRIDDEYIEFCKIILNIRSLIYQDCKVNDLIDGWNELSKTLDLVRVLELFLATSMSRLKDVDVSEIYKFEPDVIDFLKICYWYSRLRTIVTVIHKIKELRVRLAKKLLYRLESKVSINYDGLSSEEIQKMISDTIREFGKELTDFTNRRQLLNEYHDFVSVTISELMYPH